MEQRIDILEREVYAIKSEIAVIKTSYWRREEACALDARMTQLASTMTNLSDEVARIKSELKELRVEVSDIKPLLAVQAGQIAHLQADIDQLRSDLESVKRELSHVVSNLAHLSADVASTSITVQHLATKAQLQEAISGVKVWMVGIALSTITVTSAIQFALYRAFNQ